VLLVSPGSIKPESATNGNCFFHSFLILTHVFYLLNYDLLSMPRSGYQNVSLKNEVLALLDTLPGSSRPEKLERMIRSTNDALLRVGSLPDEPPDAVIQYVLDQIPSWNQNSVLELAIALLKHLQQGEQFHE